MATMNFNIVFHKMMKDYEFKKEYEVLKHEFGLKNNLYKQELIVN